MVDYIPNQSHFHALYFLWSLIPMTHEFQNNALTNYANDSQILQYYRVKIISYEQKDPIIIHTK